MEAENAQSKNFVPTISAVANEIGVHERTVKSWLGSGAPGLTENGYDVEAIREWRELNTRAGLPQNSEEFEQRILNAKLRKLEGEAVKLQAEGAIKEFQQRKLEENVVYMDAVEEFVARAFTALRRELDRVPQQLAAGYAKEIQRDLEEDLRERLQLVLLSFRSRLSNHDELTDE